MPFPGIRRLLAIGLVGVAGLAASAGAQDNPLAADSLGVDSTAVKAPKPARPSSAPT